MIKLARILRDRDDLKRYYTLFVFLWGALGISLLILRALMDVSPLPSLLSTFFYFTVQSNILITVVTFLYLKDYNQTKMFDALCYISAVNIFITSIVFHTLLIPYMSGVSFLNHITHTINPILYLGLFFLIMTPKIKLNTFWISLIYPLIYMGLIYLFIEPIFGNMLDLLMPNFIGARFVYPFLDPRTYPQGDPGLLIFNLLILAPLIAFSAFILLFFKQKFELKITQK